MDIYTPHARNLIYGNQYRKLMLYYLSLEGESEFAQNYIREHTKDVIPAKFWEWGSLEGYLEHIEGATDWWKLLVKIYNEVLKHDVLNRDKKVGTYWLKNVDYWDPKAEEVYLVYKEEFYFSYLRWYLIEDTGEFVINFAHYDKLHVVFTISCKNPSVADVEVYSHHLRIRKFKLNEIADLFKGWLESLGVNLTIRSIKQLDVS